MDSFTCLLPGFWEVCLTKKTSSALSLALMPSSGMVQRRVRESDWDALPLLGVSMLVIMKSEATFSSMTMLVAPVLVIFSASSLNSSSSSSASGVTATCVAEGSLAHSSSVATSMPSEPMRPMQ